MNVVSSQGNEISSITDEDLLDSWTVLYFYPKDFTFICPTEISAMDIVANKVRTIGITGDNEFCKVAWKEANGMIREIDHELGADCGLFLAQELGIVDMDEGVALRVTYILDEDNVIRHASANTLDTGRNADEILRTFEALLAGGLTGCNWQPGEDFVA